MTSAVSMIVIVGLVAVIAHLKNRTALAIGLVALLGALVSNTPGVLGDWADTAAQWVLDLPAQLVGLLEHR